MTIIKKYSSSDDNVIFLNIFYHISEPDRSMGWRVFVVHKNLLLRVGNRIFGNKKVVKASIIKSTEILIRDAFRVTF